MRKRPRRDCQDGLFHQRSVVRKILGELAGGGVDSDAVTRGQGAKKAGRGIAHEYRVLRGHVNVVKNHGDKTLRQYGRPSSKDVGAGGLTFWGRSIESGCGVRLWSFDAEGRDGLQFAAIVQLEVF